MKTIVGDLFKYHEYGIPIAITTNGFVKKGGECVMGRGVALQAKNRFPDFPKAVGAAINEGGNQVYYFPTYNLFTFPTKHNWWEMSDIVLIKKSCREISCLADSVLPVHMKDKHASSLILLPKPGCGNGKLNWKDVEPVLDWYLDDRFQVVEKT